MAYSLNNILTNAIEICQSHTDVRFSDSKGKIRNVTWFIGQIQCARTKNRLESEIHESSVPTICLEHFQVFSAHCRIDSNVVCLHVFYLLEVTKLKGALFNGRKILGDVWDC